MESSSENVEAAGWGDPGGFMTELLCLTQEGGLTHDPPPGRSLQADYGVSLKIDSWGLFQPHYCTPIYCQQ